MVDIETDAASAVLDALASGSESAVDRALEENALQLDFYTTHLDDVTRETFCQLLVAPEDAPQGFAVDALADGFRDAQNRVDDLRGRVTALDTTDTGRVERVVRRYLPSDPALDVTVHAVVDGFNGGYQHDGDVALSVLQTPPEQFEPKLQHELHHVGACEVREDDPFERLSRPVSPAQDVTDLVTVLLLEGLAIAFAQGGLSVYEADPDLGDTIAEFHEREQSLFADLDETLAAVATTEDPNDRQELVDSVATDPDGTLPQTHYLGARMVQGIGEAFDRDRAVNLVTAADEILPTYQRSARETGSYLFATDTVEQVSTAVSTVES